MRVRRRPRWGVAVFHTVPGGVGVAELLDSVLVVVAGGLLVAPLHAADMARFVAAVLSGATCLLVVFFADGDPLAGAHEKGDVLNPLPALLHGLGRPAGSMVFCFRAFLLVRGTEAFRTVFAILGCRGGAEAAALP